MKNSQVLPVLVLALIFLSNPLLGGEPIADDPVPGSCTIFSASKGDRVLFGNNEDFYKHKTYLWTDPATDENYGCIYLGFKDYSHQGGINEKGLCFDANALPKSSLNPHAELPAPPTYAAPYEEYAMWAPVMILRKAATVEEAIELAGKYQRKNWYPKSGELNYQLNFADASGDAVVISVDESGELAFTRKQNGQDYLISTNFNKANTENALDYPCWRYTAAEEMLAKIEDERDLTVDYFKTILETVHEEGLVSKTLYSNIFDLTNGVIYLYHWHQYDEVAVLNVKEELAKGRYQVRIKDLFSRQTVSEASTGYFMSILMVCLGALVGTAIVVVLVRFVRRRFVNHSAKLFS